MCNCSDSWAVAETDWLETWKEQEEDIQEVKIRVSYVNANQRVTSAKELNNNSMDNQPLFSIHSCHCLKGP